MVTVLPPEIYLSELLGRKVYLKQRKIGRLADVAIVETGKLPEVSHLLVKRPYGYPTLTVPWSRVLLISNTEVVLDVDPQALSEYERAPAEGLILLHDHILDKKILDLDDHEVEIVYDVKLVFQNGILHASEVDFSRYRALRRLGLRKLAKILVARNDEARVSWLYVQPLPPGLGSFTGSVKLKVPKAALSDIHPVDLADILEELDSAQRVALFNELEPEHASDTLEEVEPRVQRELISAIKKERAALLINDMTPAQAADILAILPGESRDEILKLIETDTSAKVTKLIGRHDEQIQLFGSPNFIQLRPATPAADVIRDFRAIADGKDADMYVYVTSETGVLKGVLNLREILRAPPGETLGGVMTEHVIALPFDATLRDAVEVFDRYHFRALPITDSRDRIMAVVSERDIRSVKPRLD
jgi:magnesium transporter